MSSIEKTLEKMATMIVKMQSEMGNNFGKLDKKVDTLAFRVNALEKQVNLSNSISDNISELVIDNYKVDDEFINKCLRYYSIRGDIMLLQFIFQNNIPVRIEKIGMKKNWYYYLDSKWELDYDAEYITKTICIILNNLYSRVNIDYSNESRFLENQRYIQDLLSRKNKKYKKNILDALEIIKK